jgi:glycosyltransferase involved in cell wall biosynthesis
MPRPTAHATPRTARFVVVERSGGARHRLLVLTNLFGYPWEPTRAMFNQQQFDRLAEHVDLRVLVAVAWPNALRNWRAYWNVRRDAAARWPYADYFIYWYLPGFGRSLHVPFFLLSVLLQRFGTLVLQRWDSMLGSWAYPDAVATALLGKLTGTPVVAKVHGSDINLYGDMRSRRWQLRMGLNLCRSVVAVSRPLAARLVAIGVGSEKVHTVFNGVDTSRFRPTPKSEARAALGVAADARVILFVGNLLRSKGCLDLFEAFALLARIDPALQLVFVGAGAARADVASRAAAEGLAHRVQFVGKVAHESLPAWFSACDVFCLPSHNEGLPNVILEAMSCGAPVVASRVGGIPDALPEFAGMLVEPQDADALAHALRESLERRWDRPRILAHAATFDWDANVRSMCELFAAAASKR